MKTIVAMLAMVAAMMVGGAAMACGGGASGPLARGIVKKVYKSPVQAARNAAAGAMTRTLVKQDSGAPIVHGSEIARPQLVRSTKTTKLYRLVVKDPNDEVNGSARVLVTKIKGGFRASIQSGHVDASW
jgi:hypothetical protein